MALEHVDGCLRVRGTLPSTRGSFLWAEGGIFKYFNGLACRPPGQPKNAKVHNWLWLNQWTGLRLRKTPVRNCFTTVRPGFVLLVGGSSIGTPMARGRKSEASLTVVPLVPGGGRPPAPRDLDRRERRVWCAVVGALPAPSHQLAARFYGQAVICERREARLRELRAQGQDDSEEADALAALHGTSAKALGQLLGLLRATPRSRVVSRAAGPKVEETPQARPWEIQARG
jgi:hypothetical protein